MLEHGSPRVFDILFRSAPRLRNIVSASPSLPLPPVPVAAKAPPPPSPDPAAIQREEQQAIEKSLRQLRQAVEQLGTRYDAMAAEMRQAAVELAIAVAGRVVFDKLQAGDFPIEEMVRQATARLPAAPIVTVYLHPEDLALLQRRLSDKELSPLHGSQTRFEPDPSLRRGGCRAEAGEIHVLADLASHLAELRQQLLWSASHAQSGSGPSSP
ncbi:MAG TPA: FliH/SctL family protein [Gemmataceae bacterium]|nr:FliH/SctL family protein [Gemmataceae bacterium]